MKNIYEIAKKVGIKEEYVIPYGLDKAKIDAEGMFAIGCGSLTSVKNIKSIIKKLKKGE